MTNAEKYKTVEERYDEFKKFCKDRNCESCPCRGVISGSIKTCTFEWLDLEYKEKLKPCPFCGSTPVMANNMDSMKSISYYIKCACGARFASALSESAAAEMWNRRVK